MSYNIKEKESNTFVLEQSINSKEFIEICNLDLLRRAKKLIIRKGDLLDNKIKSVNIKKKLPLLSELIIFNALDGNLLLDIICNYWDVPKLETLELLQCGVTDDGVLALVKSNIYQNLKGLALADNPITDLGAQYLAQDPIVFNPDRDIIELKIDLISRIIGDIDKNTLLAALPSATEKISTAKATNLECLVCSDTLITDTGGISILTSPYFSNLSLLCLVGANCTDNVTKYARCAGTCRKKKVDILLRIN